MPVKVTLKGPLLEGRAPGIINDVLKVVVADVAAEGERQVKVQLYSGHGLMSGHYRRSIHGETTGIGAGVGLAAAGVSAVQFFGSPHGIIHDSRVVYGPWLEGIGSRNETSRFKGYAMFRNAHQQVERLKQGMLQHRVSQALGRLG